MGITLRHDPRAAVIARAARAGGREDRRRRDEDVSERRQAQVRSIRAREDEQKRAGKRQADREAQAQVDLLARDEAQQTRALARGEAQAGFKKDAAIASEEREKVAEEEKYTQQQKREIDKINGHKQWVMSQGDWSESEKQNAIRQLDAKRLRIKPMPRPTEEKPTVQEELETRMWKDGDGNTWIMQPDGKIDRKEAPKVEKDTRVPTVPEMAKLTGDAIKALTTVNLTTGKEKRPNKKQIMEYIQDILAMREELRAGAKAQEEAEVKEGELFEQGEAEVGQLEAAAEGLFGGEGGVPQEGAPAQAEPVSPEEVESIVAQMPPEARARLIEASGERPTQEIVDLLKEITGGDRELARAIAKMFELDV